MIRILKYLVPVFFAVAAWSCEEAGIGSSEPVVSDFSVAPSAVQTNISATSSEICLPRQVSVANTLRVQSNVSRTGGLQRGGAAFVKSGKVIETGVRFLVRNTLVAIQSASADPSFRLIVLGRLII